ncbi:UNVERIFIED_CONTAM: hypothetical protein Sradi_4996600 [Sesamum radiatum]|uniref:Uncharacterized protein n=1 Tax=Sesamum radiatum TaxID=300843 RepID=A0AAW2MGZ8_SESRA
MAARGEDKRAGGEGSRKNNAGHATTPKPHLEEEIDKKEEQILKMEASVFQLANYYFVFQGVILTAIIKGSSSSLNCNHFWLPFSMSLVGAILNLCTLFTIANKYMESLDDLDERTLEYYQHKYPKTSELMYKKHLKSKERRNQTMLLSMILLVVFAVLNLLATWIIPCRS